MTESEMVERHGPFRRDLSVLPEDKKRELRELEERIEELDAEIESTPSSRPNFHNLVRRRAKAFKELEELKTSLDASYPGWRWEREDLQ